MVAVELAVKPEIQLKSRVSHHMGIYPVLVGLSVIQQRSSVARVHKALADAMALGRRSSRVL